MHFSIVSIFLYTISFWWFKEIVTLALHISYAVRNSFKDFSQLRCNRQWRHYNVVIFSLSGIAHFIELLQMININVKTFLILWTRSRIQFKFVFFSFVWKLFFYVFYFMSPKIWQIVFNCIQLDFHYAYNHWIQMLVFNDYILLITINIYVLITEKRILNNTFILQ